MIDSETSSHNSQYFVAVLSPTSVAFRPAQQDAVLRQEAVEIATMLPSGCPRPISYAPPIYDQGSTSQIPRTEFWSGAF